MSSNRGSGPVELEDKERQHLRDKLVAAIAERRHHDQIYLQSFVGGVVILGIYLVGLDGVMTRAYSSHMAQWLVFWGALVLGWALAGVFYWHIVDQRNKRDICGAIAERVNRFLAEGRLEATKLANEMSQSMIEEKESSLKKPQLPEKPKDLWQWIYMGIYMGMVILIFVILAITYWPAAQ